MFAIIAAHTVATPVIYNSADYSNFWLDFSIILAEICRGGVNIFIAISGALFLQPEKELSLSKIFRKYVLRIVLAICIFGTFFALMEIVFTEKSFTFRQIPEALLRMIQNESWGHLWYLYMLVGLYLVTPLFKRFIQLATDFEIKYILLVIFLFNLIFPLIENYTGIKIGFYIPFVGTPLFFAVI
jgi:surface polysaccharide O-acyltransferase-like enzyme